MFKDVLRNLVESTDGAVASILMGFDGIPVESYSRSPSDWNVESVGAEYSGVLGQIKQASTMLEAGATTEVAVSAESMTTVIRLLNDEYFVAMALQPSANLGKARYLMRMQAASLLEQLS
jgi:predicted regulator of Ras-like GTPase activity (Roadblock/LC7/MglB family)